MTTPGVPSPERRVGLVLSGGGFRGAYQAGFLRAVDEFGWRPNVVSGASAGALNAVLYRYMSGAEMCSYWVRQATFTAMYRVRPLGALLRFLSFLLVIPWLLANRHFRSARPGDSRSRTIADVEVGMGTDLSNTTMPVPIYLIFYCAVVGGFASAVCAVTYPHANWRVVYVVSFALFQVGPLVSRALEKMKFAALESRVEARLRETVPSSRKPRSDASPTFVSTSKVQLLWHYSNISGWNSAPDAKGGVLFRYILWESSGKIYAGGGRTAFVPEYVELRPDAVTSQMKTIAATAALPLGLVSGVADGKKIGRDSGAVDNVPLYPLLELNLEEVVVLDISSKGWRKEAFQEELPQLERLIKTAAVCQGCLVDSAMEIIASKKRSMGQRQYSITSMVFGEVVPELDRRIGVRDPLPPLPKITVIRFQRGRPWLTTLYAGRGKREEMADRGYALGVAFMSGRPDLGVTRS